MIKKINDFRIIVTTNRKKFISRLLSYYKDTEIKISIVSNFKIKNENKNIQCYFLNDNYLNSIFFGLKNTNETYSCIMHDDDIILVECLKKCYENVKFKGFSFSQGFHSTFITKNDNFETLNALENDFARLVNHKDKKKYSNSLFYSLHLDKYLPKMHAVTKTKNLYEIFESSINLAKKVEEFNSPCNQEFYFEILSCLYGKTKHVNDIYMIRDNEHELSHHILQGNKKKLWFESAWLKYNKIIIYEIKKFLKKKNKYSLFTLFTINIIVSLFVFRILLRGKSRFFFYLEKIFLKNHKLTEIFNNKKKIALLLKEQYLLLTLSNQFKQNEHK